MRAALGLILLNLALAAAAWPQQAVIEGTHASPDAHAAPRHGAELAPATVPENRHVQQTAVGLRRSDIDGIDWAAGTIRATGIGSPPNNAANPAQARAMTERAAMADAQRNLLRIVRQIKIDDARTVGDYMETRSGSDRIEGFLKGYRVVSERELPDGRYETTLELPLTGPSGLSRYLGE